MSKPTPKLTEKFCKTTGEKKTPQAKDAPKQKGCAACDCKKPKTSQ